MTLRQQIRRNRLLTAELLLFFTVLIGAVAAALYAVYGGPAAIAVGIGGLAWALFSWFLSSGVISAVTGARPVTKAEQPELYRIVENMSIAAGLPATPEVRIVDDPAPNAFAAGRDAKHCFVCATTGLLQTMDHRELEGVISHEIAHVQHRDVRLMTLVAVLVGVIAMISDIALRMLFWGGGRRRGSSPADAVLLAVGFVGLVLAPLAAIGIQLAISRRREYLADAGGAEISGDAEGLALALRKLADDPREIRDTSRSTAHLYIEGPLHKASGARAIFSGLFDTHPPLEARIAALERIGGFTLPPRGGMSESPEGH
jgi:heat shock protein HtpX